VESKHGTRHPAFVRGIALDQQVFHHFRVANVVGKFFVRRPHAEGFGEFSGLKLDVLIAEHLGDFLKKFTPDRQVGEGCRQGVVCLLIMHAVVLNQSRRPGHYNFSRFLHHPFLLSPFSLRLHLCGVELSAKEIRQAVQAALAEDIGSGDVTTLATVPETVTARAVMQAREPLVVAGLDFAEAAFRGVFPFIHRRGEPGEPGKSQNKPRRRGTPPSEGEIKISRLVKDGQPVKGGDILLNLSGPAGAILSAERVALNFVQRLSGIATLTAQFVDAVKGTSAQILDTRKTTPGWRRFEKYAVACGGGKNHRLGLFDLMLIKDNHRIALRNESPNAIAAAVRRAHEKFPQLKIEVEADTLEQVEQAADAGADIILLDNMSPMQLRLAVQKIKGRVKTEASGGVNLAGVLTIAKTGVDYISVGALTHSARAVDIGLDFES
jgi:nicotinate-nucleotide pyrophosphorylase (carboxylating)